MWKNYFYFTGKEKAGIIVLSVIIVAVFTIRFFIPHAEPEQIPQTEILDSDSHEVKSGEKGPNTKNNYQNKYPVSRTPVYTLHNFNPNTADSLTLVGLGLKPYLAKNIIKYRSKGGKFRKPEDFSKVYGLSPEKYEELKPYISFEDRSVNPMENRTKTEKEGVQEMHEPSAMAPVSSTKEEKYPSGTLVDIALADTSELKKIPRIGSAFANRIVKYRQMLGGFYSVEQVKEVYGMTPETYEEIRPWLKVGSGNITRIEVNRASVERLKSHPYINFYQAKAIVELKRKKMKLQDIQELSLLEEFSETDIKRLKFYLLFE